MKIPIYFVKLAIACKNFIFYVYSLIYSLHEEKKMWVSTCKTWMCVYACVYVSIYMLIFMCCVRINTHPCMHGRFMLACIHVCVNVQIFVYMSVRALYACESICMCMMLSWCLTLIHMRVYSVEEWIACFRSWSWKLTMIWLLLLNDRSKWGKPNWPDDAGNLHFCRLQNLLSPPLFQWLSYKKKLTLVNDKNIFRQIKSCKRMLVLVSKRKRNYDRNGLKSS